MTKQESEPPAGIQLLPATPEQAPILENLLQLYAHDFSEFHAIERGPDGRFAYSQLPLYWSDPDRHPFLAYVDGKLAGFVLVKKGSELSGKKSVWDVAEFFVMRIYRRRGIGTQIAHQLWRHFPGGWEVRVMQSNIPAYDFWARTIAMFTGNVINPVLLEKHGEYWSLFSFESQIPEQ